MSSTVASADAADPARTAILAAARAPAEAEIGRPVRFLVKRLKHDGDWVFLLAGMQDLHGRRIEYAGTPLAELAEHGVVSDDYVALLQRNAHGWTVVAHRVGPTDEVWLDWTSEYGAPAAVFAP